MIDPAPIVTRALWRRAWGQERAYLKGRTIYPPSLSMDRALAVAGNVASHCYAERQWTHTDTRKASTRLAYHDPAPTFWRDRLRASLFRRLP